MSIKKLFGKTSTSYEDTATDVESTTFIDETVETRETYIPPLDFSNPKNFVYYGSAELYYDAAIRRIYEDYPYDGSKAEQLDFEQKASHLERYVFENKYPKTVGHVDLGTTANITGRNNLYSTTSVPEYIEVHGGLHIDSTATNLDEHFEHSAKYDAAKNRTQNFNCDFTNKGITIEFWMKKQPYNPTTQPREVILDLWNGVAVGAAGYSRVFVETFDASTVKTLQITISKDGNTNVLSSPMVANEANWNHFAFSAIDNGSNMDIRFYVNGEESASSSAGGDLGVLEGRLDGFIGAMQDEIFSGQGGVAGGKLLAQLDEFRFWKVRRTSRQIKLNWFNAVGGGANTDDNTSDLGVYLKFNEGITGNATTDATVLDYSGRIANGNWVGYSSTTSARVATSAMDEAGYSETKTPIIYSTHPDVVSLTSEMQLSGSDYDSGRGQAFYRSLPSWLTQEDGQGEEDLRKLSHIMASYMDTLRVQVGALNTLADKQYYSGSQKAPPFASELLTNKGFITSDLFLSSEIFETFSNIDYTGNQFNLNIDEIKNLIYLNIYNNLENIYGSKGTEKSLRNLIRCFGIDDELLRLNQYTDFGTQYLGNKSRVTSVKKKYINLNSPTHFSGTMYQSGTLTFISGSHVSDQAVNSAFTMEADFIAPFKKELGEQGFFSTPFISASVMGFHEAMPTNPSNFTWWADQLAATAAATGALTFANYVVSEYNGKTFTLTDTNGLTKTYEFRSAGSNAIILSNGNTSVYLDPLGLGFMLNKLRSAINSGNGHNGSITPALANPAANLTQAVGGANGNTRISTTLASTQLTITQFTGGTSTFKEARDLQVYFVRDSLESKHAKFVVRNRTKSINIETPFMYDVYDNTHFNVALRIKPDTYPLAGNVTNTTPSSSIELYAVAHNFDDIKYETSASAAVAYVTGSAYLRAPKRIYAASHYQNFTGSVLYRTDLEFGRVSAWLDHIPNSSIREHNKDILNYGNKKSIDGSNAFTVDNKQVPSMDLSILNWDFDTVSSSTATGDFVIQDTTSGSSTTPLIHPSASVGIYGWVDGVVRREYGGRGDTFPNSSTTFLENEFLYAEKKQLPETSFNANNIFIKGDRQRLFSTDDDLSDNLFILEKSPAAIVSEEMLKLFSTTQEFSNLFGRHVDRYRVEYKDLARARQLFYQRVTTGLDFDKFFTYFKWIDQSISTMINQLVPASVNFAGGVTDVVESHILERSKYQRQIGLLQTVTSTEASIRGIQELKYNWKIGHAPLSGTVDNSKTPAYGLLSSLNNSLWRMERQDRTNIQTGADFRGEAAETIRQISIRQTDQEFTNPIKLSGSTPTGIYDGRTYATRRFSRPYNVGIEMGNNIHGGTNYSKGKDRDLLKSGLGLHSILDTSGAPKNVVTIGAGTGYGLNVDEVNKKQDTFLPSTKIKYGGFGLMGKFTQFVAPQYRPLSNVEDYFSRRKVNTIFIGNIISSSVNTGYASRINSGSGGFKIGVNIVNIHSDTIDISNEVPMQGPFTERHIGGNQSRHVELNSVGKPRNATIAVANDLDSAFSRPEAWRIAVGKNPLTPTASSGDPSGDTDGALGFLPPDYGIGSDGRYPDDDRLYAIYYREERAKRPLNVKNIQTTTSSVYHGNFHHQYEVFSTFGDKGYFLKRATNLLPDAISSTMPKTTNYATLMAQGVGTLAGGNLGNLQLNQSSVAFSNRLITANTTPTQDRQYTGSNHVIRTQFSAPGGPEVNSPAYLDIATQERAVYNSINFRNLSVRGSGSGETGTIRVNSHSNRREGLRTLLTRHQGKFGIDSQYGAISSADYVSEASFHKQHRNTRKVAKSLEPTAATAIISCTGAGFPFMDGSSNIILTDGEGTPVTIALNNATATSTSGVIGGNGVSTPALMVQRIAQAINATSTKMVASPTDGSSNSITVTLTTLGTIGNNRPISTTNTNVKLTVATSFTGATDDVVERYDNAHYNSLLPASDFQYSWINAAISGSNWEDGQKVLTYAPKTGIISSSVGFDSAINFPTISDVACCFDAYSLSLEVRYPQAEGGFRVAADGATLLVRQSNDAGNNQVWENDTHLMEVTGSYTGCCTDPLQYKVTLTSGSATVTYGYNTDRTPIPTGSIAYDNTGDNSEVQAVFFVKDCDGNEVTSSLTFDNAILDTSP